MKFCPKCGMKLKFKYVKGEGGAKPTLLCERCGFQIAYEEAVERVEAAGGASAPIIKVVGEEEAELQTMPTVTIECPRCKNTTAYWWMLQTRSADEAPTQFFRCTKCNYTWRQYS